MSCYYNLHVPQDGVCHGAGPLPGDDGDDDHGGVGPGEGGHHAQAEADHQDQAEARHSGDGEKCVDILCLYQYVL